MSTDQRDATSAAEASDPPASRRERREAERRAGRGGAAQPNAYPDQYPEPSPGRPSATADDAPPVLIHRDLGPDDPPVVTHHPTPVTPHPAPPAQADPVLIDLVAGRVEQAPEEPPQATRRAARTQRDVRPAPRNTPSNPDPASGAKRLPGSKRPASRTAVPATGPSGSGPAPSDPGLFPLVALIGVPVLAGAVLLFLTATALTSISHHPFTGVLLALVCGVPLAAGVRAAVRVWLAPGPSLVGAPLTGEQERRAWAAIRDVAQRLDLPMPELLAVDGSAVVTVNRTASGYNLVLGLPVLLELDRAQFATVLGAELARNTGEGPANALRVQRLGTRLESARARSEAFSDPALKLWQRLYERVATGSNAWLEADSDGLAREILGTERLLAGAYRLLAVQFGWQVLVEEYLPLGSAAGVRPRLAEGLHEIMMHRAPELYAAADTRAQRPQGRLAYTEPADVGLLDDPVTLDRIEAAILLDDGSAGNWQQIVNVVGAELIAARAQTFVGQVGTGEPEPTLTGVLTALARPDRPRVAGGLIEPLTALAQDALFGRGLARVELNWAGPNHVQRRDPWGGWIDWDGDAVVAGAAQAPDGVATLKSWLIAAGAEMDRRLSARSAEPTSAIASVEVTGPHAADEADVLIYPQGLLVVPAPAPSAMQRVGGIVQSSPGAVAEQRLDALIAAVGREPHAYRGGTWIDVASIADADLRTRRGGVDVQIRQRDGSATGLREVAASVLRGAPADDLRRLLPGVPAERPDA